MLWLRSLGWSLVQGVLIGLVEVDTSARFQFDSAFVHKNDVPEVVLFCDFLQTPLEPLLQRHDHH